MRATIASLALLPLAACACDDELREYRVPGEIAGVVCDEGTGLPVTDRVVRFEGPAELGTRTDGAGAFLIADVPEGQGTLLVGERSYDVTVTSGESTVFDDPACRPGLVEPGQGAVEGSICNRHVGALVANADVVMPLPDGSTLTTTTDAYGFFHLGDVPAGERTLQVRAPGYQRSFLVPVNDGEVYVLDVGEDCSPVDGTSGLVSGVLCDPMYSGNLAGAEVFATDASGEWFHDVTDLEGSFVVGPMAPGLADIHVVREPDVDVHLDATVVAGGEADVSALWSCGEADDDDRDFPDDDGDDGDDGGPPGDLSGRVCAPDGTTWLADALIWLDAAGTRYETTSDADGRWQLDGVPAGSWELHIERGSFSTTIPVVVEAGAVVTMPEEDCAIGQDEMLIAVVDGNYDDVYQVLLNVGVEPGIIDRYYSGWADELFGNYEVLATYDIVLIECGAPEGGFFSSSVYGANLRRYVEEGGSLYASDWAYDMVESVFPSHIELYGNDSEQNDAQVGYVMSAVFANVTDLGLATGLGQNTIEIHYPLMQWAVMQSVSSQVKVYLRADAEIDSGWSTSTLDNVPHTVGFSYGQGKVIYTSFHQEPGLNVTAERLLQLLVLEL